MIEIDVNGPRVSLYDDKGKRVDGHIRTTKEKIGFLIDKELIVRMGKVSESARAPHTLLCCIRKGNAVLTLCKFEIEWVSNIQAEAFASGSCFLTGAIEPQTAARAIVVAGRPGAIGVAGRRAVSVPLGAKQQSAKVVPSIKCSTPPSNAWVAGSFQGVPIYLPASCADRLKDHQKSGCAFLLRAVSGEASGGRHRGAILADEMGLGKTATTIALIFGLSIQRVILRAIVVVPSSLVENWKAECRTWIGISSAIKILSIEGGAASAAIALQEFGCTIVPTMLILSYEMACKHCMQLAAFPRTLLVADEAHRLKAENKTMKCLKSLQCAARVALTGTPIQNNLLEYYHLMNFVNPGLLGDSARHFQDVFQEHIENGRGMGMAESRAAELQARVAPFVLRRTGGARMVDVPIKHLVLLVNLTQEQALAYRAVCRAYATQRGEPTNVLELITAARHLCSHVCALGKNSAGIQAIPVDPTNDDIDALFASSLKLIALASIIAKANAKGEQVVVVSDLMAVLDLVGRWCAAQELAFCRIDGSIPASARQDIVNACEYASFRFSSIDLPSTNADTHAPRLQSIAGGPFPCAY